MCIARPPIRSDSDQLAKEIQDACEFHAPPPNVAHVSNLIAATGRKAAGADRESTRDETKMLTDAIRRSFLPTPRMIKKIASEVMASNSIKAAPRSEVIAERLQACKTTAEEMAAISRFDRCCRWSVECFATAAGGVSGASLSSRGLCRPSQRR